MPFPYGVADAVCVRIYIDIMRYFQEYNDSFLGDRHAKSNSVIFAISHRDDFQLKLNRFYGLTSIGFSIQHGISTGKSTRKILELLMLIFLRRHSRKSRNPV
jgi:hypothetical protein